MQNDTVHLPGAGGFHRCVHAVEYSVSGFGTLGAKITDEATVYQRYIDYSGTLMCDSLLGMQLDIKLNEQWGAAAQVRIAPRTDDDTGVEPHSNGPFSPIGTPMIGCFVWVGSAWGAATSRTWMWGSPTT